MPSHTIPAVGGAGGGAAPELKMAGRYYKPGSHAYGSLTITAAAGAGLPLNAASFPAIQTYLPTGSEADGNTGGYKFTPTESGLLQVAVDYRVAQASASSNIATDVTVEIASDDFGDFTGFRRLSHRNSDARPGFHGAVFIDFDEWTGDQAIGVLFTITNREAVNAMRFAYFQWQVLWTPLDGISPAFSVS